MIIGIDGNEANVEKRVGISEYAFQLLTQFSNLKNKEIKFIIYLKDEPGDEMPAESQNWQYRILKPGKLWTQWRLPLDLFTHHPVLMFFSVQHIMHRDFLLFPLSSPSWTFPIFSFQNYLISLTCCSLKAGLRIL